MTTKTKTTPTFRQGATLLTGEAARQAWADQPGARCGCGRYGDEEHSLSGTASDMPATWLACPVCHSAVGQPLVYRLPSQMDV